jgi:hypothetical protein
MRVHTAETKPAISHPNKRATTLRTRGQVRSETIRSKKIYGEFCFIAKEFGTWRLWIQSGEFGFNYMNERFSVPVHNVDPEISMYPAFHVAGEFRAANLAILNHLVHVTGQVALVFAKYRFVRIIVMKERMLPDNQRR